MAWLLAPSPRLRSPAPCRLVPRACAARNREVVPDHAVAVAPASLESLPYPGESISLPLGTEQLRLLAPASLLNHPPRALLYLPPVEGPSERAGALLSVSAARPDGVFTATVEATSIARARVENTIEDVVLVSRVHDWSVLDYSERMELAKAMKMASNIAEQARQIRGRLGTSKDDESSWARLRATRADEFDTELLEDDWDKTPPFVRETWCKRAELFSFAAVRYAGKLSVPDGKKAEIWDATDTLQRVNLACELLIAAKAEASAKLSLKNALG